MPRTGENPLPDWDARTYHRVSAPQLAWGKEVLERLPLAGTETVIDAGCGTGRLTAELLERLPEGRGIAVDQSEAMLEEARAGLLPRYAARIRWVRADLTALSVEDGADAAFSAATFHWIKDHDRLFGALFRALKPGGRLVAQCGGGENLERVHRRAAALMASPRFAPHFENWEDPWLFASAPQTQERLARAGFEGAKAWLSPAPTVFPDAAALDAFLRTVVLRPHLAKLPSPALQNEFAASLVEAASRDAPPFALDYVRLNLEGTRPR